MDESGLHLHFRPGKVLAAKGDRSALQVTQSERAENVTVVVLQCQTPVTSPRIFLKWLHHFNQHKVPGKAILLTDGHASHVKSIAVIDLAVSYDITMVCLPPHTTHYLQPLDRAFFKPLKVHYDSACRTFLSNHPGRQITKLQFGSLLSEAWGRAATPGTASNGFRSCGIFPLNKAAIPDNAFMPSTVSDIPLTDASTDEAIGRSAVTASAAAVISTAGSTADTPLEPAATTPTSPLTPTVTETVTQTDPLATRAVSSTPTKTTPTTFAMLHPTSHMNGTKRVADCCTQDYSQGGSIDITSVSSFSL